jgi:quercetin dioxygenase-like cupin family protein
MRKTLLAAVAAIALTSCGEAQRETETVQDKAAASEEPTAAEDQARRTDGSSAAGNEAPLAIAATDPALEWGPCPDIFPVGCEITVLHGHPAGPNADAMLRVQPGVYLPPHRHTSAERMILVGGRFQVAYQGSEPITLNAGDYAYGPANLAHDARCLGTEPCTLFIAFETPVDAVAVEGAIN